MKSQEEWEKELKWRDRNQWRFWIAICIIGLMQLVGSFNGLRLLIIEWYDDPHVSCATTPLVGQDGNDILRFPRCPTDHCCNAPSGARVPKTS